MNNTFHRAESIVEKFGNDITLSSSVYKLFELEMAIWNLIAAKTIIK